MYSNSRREKCWCRHQSWIRWFQHARISAHKYFDDGADCSELCGESVHKDNIANSHDPRHLCLWNICISSCALFHPAIYVNSMEMYISWRKLNFCCEKVTVVFQHWIVVESYWHWILRCVHLVILQKDACLWKMCISEIWVDHRRMRFHRRLYRLAAARLRQSHLTSNAGNVMDLQTEIESMCQHCRAQTCP